MEQLVSNLRSDFPALTFTEGKIFCWSPKQQEIVYTLTKLKATSPWALLHEVGHGLLGHFNYTSDFELLRLEVAAWEKAREIASRYDIKISDEHIQNCLDTYREWLHRRSTCPHCSNRSLQQNHTAYHCFNCQTTWQVSASRFCRAYRQLERGNKKAPTQNAQTLFS